MKKSSHAFVDENFQLPSNRSGKLNALSFAVKDVFDIKGNVTGLGNPIWKLEHQNSTKNAPCIQKLLENGATLKGITVSDEFMFSIKGSNKYYGNPLNPKHPDCYTGGSSSGSASVVAQGIVDFALGTDTGGSIRVPASYCELFGFRPTHNLDKMQGVAPLAQSFDTVGLLAAKPTVLEKVGKLLYDSKEELDIKKIYYLSNVYSSSKNARYLKAVFQLSTFFNVDASQVRRLDLTNQFELFNLYATFKDIQGYEAWKNYGDWIEKHIDSVGKDIGEHFNYASKIADDSELLEKYQLKRNFSSFLTNILKNNGIIVLPTTSSSAPEKKLAFDEYEALRSRTQKLTTIAGLAGLPQLVIPLENDFSLSVITGPDTDASLLSYVKDIFDGLNL